MKFFEDRVVGNFFAVFMRKSDGAVERIPTIPLSQIAARELCNELNATLSAVSMTAVEV